MVLKLGAGLEAGKFLRQSTSILQNVRGHWPCADCSLADCKENGPDMHAVETTSVSSRNVLTLAVVVQGASDSCRFPSSNEAVPVKNAQGWSAEVFYVRVNCVTFCRVDLCTNLTVVLHKFGT